MLGGVKGCPLRLGREKGVEHMHRRIAALLATMALAMLLATGMASAITYGQPDGNIHPNVGALVVADEQGEFLFCSGTLIAPDVFLTAAHCTAAIEQFGLEFRGVTFDSVFDPDTSVVHPGTPYTHPEYPGPSSDAKDIAVVVLNDEVTGIQPALLPSLGLLDQLANDGALKGQSFTAVGYGATERTHEPGSGSPVFGEGGTRMYSVSTFSALNKGFLRLSQNPSTGDGGTCYGDSGGPNFLGAGPSETNIIASITITGDVPCRSRNVTYRLDTPTARDFLDEFVTLP
jgi:secreted trypsin-like serine protease